LKERLEVKADFWGKPEPGPMDFNERDEAILELMRKELRAGIEESRERRNEAMAVVLEGEVVEAENVEPEVFESKDITPYEFAFKDNRVRTAIVDGEVMFHGGDVCKILGYGYPKDTIKRHCKYAKTLRSDETSLLNLNPRGELFFPESDLYRLTLRSNMPDAGVFQDWICEDVIPTQEVVEGKLVVEEISTPKDLVPFTFSYNGNPIRTVTAKGDEVDEHEHQYRHQHNPRGSQYLEC
jgi:prophage antirepressor-like protein